MKINRVGVFFLLCGSFFQTVTAEIKASKAWQADSQAIYDLLVAQMQNSSADFGGSADALVRYAKSQKDDRLYVDAYAALLRTQRYADAVKLVKDWRKKSKLKLDKYYLLALVLNNEIDLAMTMVDKRLEDAANLKNNPILASYVQILVTHWYDPNVLEFLSRLYDHYAENELLTMTLVKQLRWQGEVDKAIKLLDKALFDDPRNIVLLQEKSDVYRYALRLKEAENVWRNILKDYPSDIDFQFAYARFLFDRYNFVAAEKLLATMKPKAKQKSRVDLLRVMSNIQLGDYQAIARIIDWEQMDENEKNRLYYDVANLLLDAKQPQLAKQYFDKIKVVDKVGRLALAIALQMGKIHYQESLEKGNQWFVDVQEKFHLSDAEAVKEKVVAMRTADLDKAAYQLLSDYLAANPKNEEMRYLRGLVAAEMYKEKRAAEDLGMLHATSPDNTDVQNALGYTLLSTADGDADKLQAAGQLIKKALFVQSDSPAVVDSMGWLLYQQKSYEQSLPYLRFAYAYYSDGEVIGHYIAALVKSGRLALAKKLYQLEMQYPLHQEKIKYYTKPMKEQLQP